MNLRKRKGVVGWRKRGGKWERERKREREDGGKEGRNDKGKRSKFIYMYICPLNQSI